MQPAVTRNSRARERARSLLRHNSGTLGHWTTWRGNFYWENSAGDLIVAYRVVRGVALALTEPISSREIRAADIGEFALFCSKHRWVPAFHAIQEPSLEAFHGAGWQSIPVGQEALLAPEAFEISDAVWHKVRHAQNRAERFRVQAKWVSWRELSIHQHSQIRALSQHWVAQKRLPRLGFTLGGVRELTDPDVKLMIGVSQGGDILALTSWLPVYRDGRVVGRTLDLMRRSPDAFNGINEFLIGAAIQRAKLAGETDLSLSGVPFGTQIDSDSEVSWLLPRLVYRLLAARVEASYGFGRLYAFKLKFRPELRNIYLTFPSQGQLPRIVLALARAYLPSFSLAKLLAMLVRPEKTAN